MAESQWRGGRDGNLQSEARFLQPPRLRRACGEALRTLFASDVHPSSVPRQRLYAMPRLRRATGGEDAGRRRAAAGCRGTRQRQRPGLALSISIELLANTWLFADLRRLLLRSVLQRLRLSIV